MKTRGFTLIESMVASIILILVGLGMYAAFFDTAMSRESIMYANNATTNGREPIDVVADHLRNAQQYTADNVTYTCISAAGASSVTYYTDSAGSTITYYLESGSLKSDQGGTVKTVVTGLSTLTFTYYLAASTSSYYSTSLAATDPSTFGATERARIAAILISGSVAVNGYPRSFSTMVRLRNSPRKVSL
jgi:prepilin-type N-terminal cleavage/methylation domain-containing protein